MRKLNLFVPLHQFEQSENGYGRRILLIGAGQISVPPDGWGAVETIIHEQRLILEANEYSVDILNSLDSRKWKMASRQEYLAVICHDDSQITRTRKFFPNCFIINVCHYGYLSNPEKWDPSFKRLVPKISKADLVIVLSEACKDILSRYLPRSEIIVVPNGISDNNFINQSDRCGIVCVGKIESRKRQIEIAKRYPNMDIDFVGPADRSSAEIIEGLSLETRSKFIGGRNRDWLYANLGKYEYGLLLSDGEADALVIYEYQLAGLKVIISSAAAGSTDTNLPWVKLTSIDDLQNALEHFSNLDLDPKDISRHAQEEYNWSVRALPLLRTLSELSSRG
jgi:hypothetical protein